MSETTDATATTDATVATVATPAALAHGARQSGICKWFDKTKGFGFVQGLSDKQDYFTHHTQLSRPPSSLAGSSDASSSSSAVEGDHASAFEENAFRYLLAGEYVEFTVDSASVGTDTRADTHPTRTRHKRVLAVCVTGIQGGPLMFQTQFDAAPPSGSFGEYSPLRHSHSPFPARRRAYRSDSRGGGEGTGHHYHARSRAGQRPTSTIDHDGFSTVAHRNGGTGRRDQPFARRSRHPHATTGLRQPYGAGAGAHTLQEQEDVTVTTTTPQNGFGVLVEDDVDAKVVDGADATVDALTKTATSS